MIGVLLITHGRLGAHFVETLSGMLGELSLPTQVLEVHRNDDPDVQVERAATAMTELNNDSGVLVITDAFGSTPSNIANRAHASAAASSVVVTGINLPMLIRIYNYPQLSLRAAADSAIEAGRNGIIAGDRTQPN